MGVEWIAGMTIVLALACVGGAVLLFLGSSWLMQWLRGTAGLLLVAIAGYFILFAAGLFNYQQALPGSPLATVSFERTGDQAWMVSIAEANGDRRQFSLLGDLWEMDIRLLRYSGLLSPFNVEPSFRLERLAGRYISLEDQVSKDGSEYRLLPEPFLGYDIWERAKSNGSLLLDAERGSLLLVPILDGAIYEVRLGGDALALAPANSVAEDALRGPGG